MQATFRDPTHSPTLRGHRNKSEFDMLRRLRLLPAASRSCPRDPATDRLGSWFVLRGRGGEWGPGGAGGWAGGRAGGRAASHSLSVKPPPFRHSLSAGALSQCRGTLTVPLVSALFQCRDTLAVPRFRYSLSTGMLSQHPCCRWLSLRATQQPTLNHPRPRGSARRCLVKEHEMTRRGYGWRTGSNLGLRARGWC